MSNPQETINQLARQFGFSPAGVAHLWEAMRQGRGTMAQFNHPELGGLGQWQAGGMLMIGDMFNHGLKAKVAALCHALHPLVAEEITREVDTLNPTRPQVSPGWWPAEYGQPATSGSQNRLHYVYFPEARRLVIETEGLRQIYDTGSHHITGFSQQDGHLRFRSQLGTFGLSELQRVER